MQISECVHSIGDAFSQLGGGTVRHLTGQDEKTIIILYERRRVRSHHPGSFKRGYA